MRALDRNLRSYIESLPKDTLVVLYGDHTSNVDYGDFHSAHSGLAEFVPCIVHVCQEPLVQQTNAVASESLPQDLRIHDVINFLRRQIANR
jgi:NDP-sugar pyrophosphorylase family protein